MLKSKLKKLANKGDGNGIVEICSKSILDKIGKQTILEIDTKQKQFRDSK